MRDIVVALSNTVDLNQLARTLIASSFQVIGPLEDSLDVRLDGDTVQFVHDQSLLQQYEPEERTLLAPLGKDPNLFLVSFKNTASLGKVLAYIVDRPDAIVDNDFGVIESGADFVKRFRDVPAWDWIIRTS
jgi:hypothetical protein